MLFYGCFRPPPPKKGIASRGAYYFHLTIGLGSPSLGNQHWCGISMGKSYPRAKVLMENPSQE